MKENIFDMIQNPDLEKKLSESSQDQIKKLYLSDIENPDDFLQKNH